MTAPAAIEPTPLDRIQSWLDRENSPAEDVSTQTSQEPKAEAPEPEEPDPEAPPEGTEEAEPEASDNAQLEGDDAPPDKEIRSLGDLASSLETNEEALSRHLMVRGRDGQEFSLHDVIESHRRPAPEAAELQQTRTRISELETRERDWVDATEQLRATAQQFAAQLQASEPNWSEIQQSDPQGYLSQRVQWLEHRQSLERAAQLHQDQASRAQEDEGRRVHAFRVEQARRLKASVPEWSDSQVFERDLGDVAKYLMTQDLTQEDVNQLSDSRDWIIARKAMLWDRIQTKKPKALQRISQLPKVVVPGAARGSERGAAAQSAKEGEERMARLKETGSDAAAVSAIEHQLNRNRLRAAGRQLSAGRRT